MKTLVFWVWAFWFAILNHISKNNPKKTFYAYDKLDIVLKNVVEKREHPYFFPWVKIWENIEIVNNLEKTLATIDLIIIAMPSQVVVETISWIKNHLNPGVTLLNLSKWLNNWNCKTIWESLSKELDSLNFNYWVLSGGMIATELVNWSYLWADLGIEDEKIWEDIKQIFKNDKLEINIVLGNTKNIELYWSLKNIIAIWVWYYEWKWYKASTLWYYLCKFYDELKSLIKLLWWSDNLEFSDFSLGWDLIATCFWDSRNRTFWKLLWQWKKIDEILDFLSSKNKIAEWYSTLKWIYKITKDKSNFPLINKIWIKIFY